MHDKSILITGCSSGIGRCAAFALQQRGYRVFATARKTADVAALQQAGLESVRLDLDDSASLQQALEEILTRTGGRLDALFNNGAFAQPGAVEDLSRDALRRQFETNLFGTVELTNRVITVMRRQGYGRVVQNSSVLGLVSLAYRGAYNATKHALEAITDTMRQELHGSGIMLSLIEPGAILTRFRANSLVHFANNIDHEHSVHWNRYAALLERLNKPGPAARFTLPPEAVVKKLIHALEAKRPKLRYYVTGSTYFAAYAKRFLTHRALDWFLRKNSG